MKLGRVIGTAIVAMLFLLFVAIDLVVFGAVALNSAVVTALPLAGLVLGGALGALASKRLQPVRPVVLVPAPRGVVPAGAMMPEPPPPPPPPMPPMPEPPRPPVPGHPDTEPPEPGRYPMTPPPPPPPEFRPPRAG